MKKITLILLFVLSFSAGLYAQQNLEDFIDEVNKALVEKKSFTSVESLFLSEREMVSLIKKAKSDLSGGKKENIGPDEMSRFREFHEKQWNENRIA